MLASIALADSFFDFFFLVITYDDVRSVAIQSGLGHSLELNYLWVLKRNTEKAYFRLMPAIYDMHNVPG